MRNRFTILTVDPGFASFGYGIVAPEPKQAQIETVVAIGCIRTEKSNKKANVLAVEDNLRRTREISRVLAELLDRHQPLAVCAEYFSPPRNSSAAAKVGFAWGALIAMLDHRQIPLVQVSPQQVKKTATGAKSASKEDVQAFVNKRYGADELEALLGKLPAGEWEHPYDALAVYVACKDGDVMRAVTGSAERLPGARETGRSDRERTQPDHDCG